MSRRARFAKYRRALRSLRAECPTHYRVRVRLNHTNRKLFGWTSVDHDAGTVSITVCTGGRRRGNTPEELRETIVHEWAHAMVMRPHVPGDAAHDAEWGVAYARAYQAAVED